MSAVTHSDVQDYYGKELKTKDDLKTNACCTAAAASMPRQVKEALKLCHEEVLAKFYGCGGVFPQAVEGCRVLDLGCGTGRDCFVLSKLVGPKGHVTGVDMTPEQLEVARRHTQYHMMQFGHTSGNVDFLEGYIENLRSVGIPDNVFDVVVSNCVINLVPDKVAVFREVYRVLKSGGELCFSDVYSSHPVPEDLRKDKVLWGECLSGALEWTQLVKCVMEIGFAPPVLVGASPLTINNAEIERKIGGIQFCSATYRIFKVDTRLDEPSEPIEEVLYKGTIPDCEDSFQFSYNLSISKCCPTVISSSLASLLKRSRYAPHFAFKRVDTPPEGGAPSLFDYVHVNPFVVQAATTASSCCS